MELLLQGLNSWLGQTLPDWAVTLLGIAITIILILLLPALLFMLLVWLLRRGIARFADRFGPNRVGIGPFNPERTRQRFPVWGLMQSVADAIKMFTKEDITPSGGDKWLHRIAPIAALVPTFLVFAVVPFGRQIVGADLNVGVLYVVAVSGLFTIVVIMAGFASNNKFSLLGAMRSAAQMLSYEIPMVLALLVPVLFAGTLSLNRIVEAQGAWFGLRWFIFYFPLGPIAFLVYFIAALAEVSHTPFDLPEADSELVAGYVTEYSGMKFALFFMAEFLNQFLICALAVTLFLGGWQGPGVQLGGVLGYLFSIFWFFLKTFILYFGLIWIRGTWPRLRVDQLMHFAWKRLVPVALGNVLVTGLAVIAVNLFKK